MAIKLTKSAVKEIKKVMEDQKLEDNVLRVGISGGGCSGFSYRLGFEKREEIDELNDNVIEQDDLTIVVDRKSSLYLEGTEVDWVDELSKRGFKFNNPNSVKNCGCGQSFSV